MSDSLNRESLIKIIESAVRDVLFERGIIPKPGLCIDAASSVNLKNPAAQEKSILENSLSPKTRPVCLVLFTGTDLHLDSLIGQLKNLSAKAELRLVPTKGFMSFYPLEKIKETFPASEVFLSLNDAEIAREIARASALLIPFLTRNTAAKVALGITDSLAANLIYQALAKGLKIIAVKSGADPFDGYCGIMANLPIVLKSVLREYILILQKAGVIFPEPERFYYEAERNIVNTRFEKTDIKLGEKGMIETKRTVITVEDVAFFFKTSGDKKYHIPSNAIITPAAADFAIEKNIEFIKGERV